MSIRASVKVGMTRRGGGAPVPIGNARLVGKGDSISIGAGGGGDVGAINLMTFPGTVAITNQGVSSSKMVTHLDQIVAGGVSALYQADRPCVAILQGGTNDIGEFANGTPGVSGALLYDYAGAAVRLLRAQGFRTVLANLLPRSDVFMTAQKQIDRTAYNALVVGNVAGSDVALDLASNATMSNPANATYYADLLHPTATGQGVLAPLYQAAIDPLIRGTVPLANREVTALAQFGTPAYASGKYGQGLSGNGGGAFFFDLMIPSNMSQLPLSIEWWSIKTSAAQQAVFGKLRDGGTLPFDFWAGTDASGNAYAAVNNGAGVMATGVNVSDSVAHFNRLVFTASNTKYEIDGGAVTTTAAVVSSGGTRAARLHIQDGALGIADFTGVSCGHATFNTDRTGAGVPAGHMAPGTANMRAYAPLERHLSAWS